MRRRREFEIFSMSFLDAICCGFGAMILLFLVTRTSEPARLEQSERDLDGLIAQYEQELNEIVGETERVRRHEATTTSERRHGSPQIEDLREQLERIRAQVLAVEDPTLTEEVQNRLASAKQSLDRRDAALARRLSAADRRIQGRRHSRRQRVHHLPDRHVGQHAEYQWDRVQQQLRETLEVYPTVKGIQIMNDEGEYMFKSYRDEWIPDTPTRRKRFSTR